MTLYVFSKVQDLAGGHHESGTGAEGCGGVGGIAFCGGDLSDGDVFVASKSVG